MEFSQLFDMFSESVKQVTTEKESLEEVISSLRSELDKAKLKEEELQRTIQDLITAQDLQKSEITVLTEELSELNLRHEKVLQEVLESSHYLAEKRSEENQSLINDILRECDEMMHQLKLEFENEAKDKPELKETSGQGMLEKFRALPTHLKEIMTAIISAIGSVTFARLRIGWGFITWLWPRLVSAAQFLWEKRGTIQAVTRASGTLFNSGPFQRFVKSWENGRPLTECLNHLESTEFLGEVQRVGPEILTALRKVSA